MTNKMSLILFSGTEDKLMAASIIASGAVANDMEVNIFVTFWGLTKTTKTPMGQPELSFEGQPMKEQVFSIMKQKQMPSWIAMLNNAKEVGEIHVYGCAMFADLMGLKQEDLDPIVEDVIGVNQFVEMSKDTMTLFI